MDEKQFPEQDESQSSFEETPDIPIQQEPDTIPEPITPDEEFPDEIFSIPGDQDTAVEFSSSIQDSPTDEHPPEPVSFMDRIPDVNDPEESPRQAEGDFSQPVLGEEITPDEGAMDFHGMLGHGEEEPPFDMDLLNDPELSEPQSPDESDSSDQEYRDNGQDLDAVPDSQAKESEAEHRERPVRKGRPKRKKGEGLLGIPNILVTFVWLALILAIGVTAGRMLWVCASDVLAFGREDQVVTITIYESDTMDDIIEKLYSNGLIRYRSLFQLYASISDAEEDIQPGIYDLNTRYDYHALVNSMSPSSSRSVVQLTIPEGYTCRQIFDLLEENRVCTAVDIGAYASDGELDDYWFLENVERGSEYCLEGFLFPDTYQFYKNSTPREALEKMLDNFEVRFNEEMRAQIETLNANVTGGGYTVREVVIVASLIEREAAAPSEAAAIAGVIYNLMPRAAITRPSTPHWTAPTTPTPMWV